MDRKISIKRQEAIAAYTFILPFVLSTVLFAIIPVIYTIYMSFMNYNTLGDLKRIKFAGWSNYISVFTNPDQLLSFVKSIEYAIFEVPLMMIFSMLLALALNRKLHFRGAIRTMLLIPYACNIVAISIAWQAMLDPYGGPVNHILNALGIQNPPQWFQSMMLALPMTAVVYVYANVSYQATVYFAAIQGIPGELYEAADIDGAGKWSKFLRITLPCVSPTTFFLLVTSVLGAFQNYSIIAALTGGGPAGASEVAAFSITKYAFTYNQFSIATAQSTILFLLLMIITLIQFGGQKRWVNY